MQINFKCPVCGGNHIGEVTKGIVPSVWVHEVEPVEKENLDYYMCRECGYRIPVKSPKELCDWLVRNLKAPNLYS